MYSSSNPKDINDILDSDRLFDLLESRQYSIHARKITSWLQQNWQSHLNWQAAGYPDFSIVHLAAACGATDVLEQIKQNESAFFLKQINADSKLHGHSPLSLAANFGRSSTARWLLQDKHVDYNWRLPNGRTPAHLAAEKDHSLVLDKLYIAGANLNIPDNDGWTPALIASANNKLSSLVSLVSARVDMSQGTPIGTPLQIAHSNGAELTTEYLNIYSYSPKDFHQRLIAQMISLGYGKHFDGICHGIALMGIQACLSGNIFEFNERLMFIAGREDLKSEIESLREKMEKQSSAGEKVVLSENDKMLIDVMAFFDGVALSQNPEPFSDVFSNRLTQNHVDATTKFTSSIALEEKGGLLEVKSWLGIYNDNELQEYLQFMNETATSVGKPFSLLLGSDNHAIALHFDPGRSGWYMLDANQLPITPLYVNMAEWIKSAFMETSGVTIFSTGLFVTGDAQKTADQLNNVFSNSEKFKEIHTLTMQKAGLTNGNGKNIATLAAKTNHPETLNELHHLGIDLSKQDKLLMDAAGDGFATVVKVLIDAGCDVNARDDMFQQSAVSSAAKNGHAEIIEQLHASGADINYPNFVGLTPLQSAAIAGDSHIIKALGNLGVKLDQVNRVGYTLAHLAARANQSGVIEYLTKIHFNLNSSNKEGETPAQIAAEEGNIKVLQALADAGVNLVKPGPNGITPLAAANTSSAPASIEFLNEYAAKKAIDDKQRSKRDFYEGQSMADYEKQLQANFGNLVSVRFAANDNNERGIEIQCGKELSHVIAKESDIQPKSVEISGQSRASFFVAADKQNKVVAVLALYNQLSDVLDKEIARLGKKDEIKCAILNELKTALLDKNNNRNLSETIRTWMNKTMMNPNNISQDISYSEYFKNTPNKLIDLFKKNENIMNIIMGISSRHHALVVAPKPQRPKLERTSHASDAIQEKAAQYVETSAESTKAKHSKKSDALGQSNDLDNAAPPSGQTITRRP